MTTDTALIEKREELKRRLTAGEYKTLVDVFLEWFERLLRKVTRRTEPLPLWSIATTLSLVVVLVTFFSIYIAGDLVTIRDLFNKFGSKSIPLISILLGAQAILSTVAINHYIRLLFAFLHDEMLDATESLVSLDDLKDWLKKTSNQRWQFLTAIIGGVLGGLYLVVTIKAQFSVFIGYGSTLAFVILSISSASFFYLFIMVITLSARLRRYDLKLFIADPSSSKLIARLSNELGFFVYFIAVYAAILTLISVLNGKILAFFGFFLVLFLWLPIIALFILNQTSLSSIIRRAKWKTLNEIQSQVEELRATNNLKDKETMEAINRLMDFHDRVKATRNSAIDSSTILNFINSLLLPLIAFLLGNLDKVVLLFTKKP